MLQFSPERVVARYQEGTGELVRDCVHAVLHCTFHHPFEKRFAEHAAWSLASDIAVELCALELCAERFPSEHDGERREAGGRLAALAGAPTAPALYQLFRCGAPGEALYRARGFTDTDLQALAELFKRDAHDLWATHPGHDAMAPQAPSAMQPPPDLQAGSERPGAAGAAAGMGADKAQQDSREGGAGTPGAPSKTPATPGEREGGEENATEPSDKVLAEQWERISKRVEAELAAERHSLNGEGGLLQNLRVANRKPADYDSFLRRFATMAEDMRTSDEEFDYVYYTYGLARYGNVPLVEPLEYQESKRVREFVIALDTSGSCSGELVRIFVQRTYDILRQQTSFGNRINVHLVQCDNRVRSATKVTSLAQLEGYADSFWVSGGGGTDFKPVFAYVDELVEAGEFSDLRGLIYFTDGYGAFPVRVPDYEVAFVFVDDGAAARKVPGWAMKVTMTQDEVVGR